MNRNEKKVLGSLTKAAIANNVHAWNGLKYQIFDYGYQIHYAMQDEFRTSVRNALRRLMPEQKLALQTELAKHLATPLSDDEMLEHYTHVVIDEIVRRATVASSRTENW